MTTSKKQWFYPLLAFLLPVLFVCAYFLSHQITPFGDGSFLIHDMNAQYVDYFAYFRSVLSGQNDFVYSFSRGLGGEFRSFFAYYLASPLNSLIYLLPDALTPTAVSIEMLILFGLAGLSCYFCLRHFTADDSLTMLFLTTAYSLSGWMVLNAENFQFLSEAAVLPMVVLSLRKAHNKGKIVPAVIWLAVCVAVNFYIGYMICLFAVLWFLVVERKKIDWRFFLIFIGAAALSLPVWLPVVRQLGLTVKNADPSWYEPRLNYSFLEFARKFLPGQFDAEQYQDNGLPAVYCGLVTLVLAALYFFRGAYTTEKKQRLLLLLTLYISLVFRPLTMIWQGFSEPRWWPYRFSFLLIFMLILCAAEIQIRVPWFLLLLAAGGLFYNLDRTFDVKLKNAVPASVYAETVTKKAEQISSMLSEDGGMFRIEDLSPRSDNDALHFAYSGITNFDSLANQSMMDFLSRMGFPLNRYTIRYGFGNTKFANQLLGIRYVLDGDAVIPQSNDAGMVFLLPENMDLDDPSAENAFDFQNALAERMGGRPPLKTVEPISYDYDKIECTEDFCWVLDPEVPGRITVHLAAMDADGFLYVHVARPYEIGDLTIAAESRNIPLSTPDYFLPYGKVSAGDFVSVELMLHSPMSEIPALEFVLEDGAADEEIFGNLFKDVSAEKISSSEVHVHIASSPLDRLLVMTVPYEPRWHAAADGIRLQTDSLCNMFLAVHVPAGTSEITLRYR